MPDRRRLVRLCWLCLIVLAVTTSVASVLGGGAGGPASPHATTYGPVAPGGFGAPDAEAAPTETPESVERIHDAGVTGEGVTVGVVGSGFDADAPAIEDDVTATVDFGTDRNDAALPDSVGDDDPAHDTAVAEVVTRTAPDADLRLAAVGRTPTPREYRAAVEWLIASDVDVIVDAGTYFPRDADTASGFRTATRRAAAADTPFVTSAGNYAGRHWDGAVDGAGWVAFDGNAEANALGDGPIAGDVSVRLHWAGDADLELYLYRYVPDGRDRVVAEDAASDGVAAVDATVPRGRYYVAIRAPEAGTEASVDLYAPTHELEFSTAADSVGPAAPPEVITVGATAPDGSLRADSSRRDVTLGAPGRVRTSAGDLEGTSAAAPFVAGTIALMAESGHVSPDEGRTILVATADRGDDVARVDPESAVELAAGTEIAPARHDDGRASGSGAAGNGTVGDDATAGPVDDGPSTGR